jgi:hypothetical protein
METLKMEFTQTVAPLERPDQLAGISSRVQIWKYQVVSPVRPVMA